MRKQLQQMEIELRELMVYQCPKELGALYTEVEEMMKQMGKEQSVLIVKQMQRQAIEDKRNAKRKKEIQIQFFWGIAIMFIIFVFCFIMMLVAQSRQQMYPQYGNDWLPKTEEERRKEALPHVYIGR
jgi:heme/copper-type cytochrome/quinol oxidase subunit 3